MPANKKIAQAAIASVIALGSLATTQTAFAADAPKHIKCYGIAAAGKNDCGSVAGSCSGTVKEAKACYAWIYAPKGVCEKIAGSSVDKPAAGCKGPNGKLVAE